MDNYDRKPRRVESADERALRLDGEARKAMDRALAEQDALDALVRKSIEQHGALECPQWVEIRHSASVRFGSK